jgi:hypothetical protein
MRWTLSHRRVDAKARGYQTFSVAERLLGTGERPVLNPMMLIDDGTWRAGAARRRWHPDRSH